MNEIYFFKIVSFGFWVSHLFSKLKCLCGFNNAICVNNSPVRIACTEKRKQNRRFCQKSSDILTIWIIFDEGEFQNNFLY